MRRAFRVLGCIAVAYALVGPPAMAQEKREIPVEGLIYDLRHPDAARRKEAARLLGENRIRQAVPALVDATRDRSDDVRLAVVEALVKIRDTRALDSYVRLASDEVKAIQRKAIQGIVDVYVSPDEGFVQDVRRVVDLVNPLTDDYNPVVVEPYVPVSEAAVEVLAAQLSAADNDVRREAATALGILRARAALPSIRTALGRETADGVLVELIRTAYKISDPEIGDALIPLIQHPSKRVHDEAIFAVGRLHVAQAVGELRSLYESGIEERKKVFGVVPVSGKDDLQRKTLEALACIGDPSTRDLFVNALNDPRNEYRQFSAEGLGRIGASDLVDDLASMYLRERDGTVKTALSFALYRTGRDEHLAQLVAGLAQGDQSYNYLLEMTSDDVPRLYPFLKSERERVRVRILDVIGLRGDHSAIAVAREAARQDSADVAAAANNAIRRIRGRLGWEGSSTESEPPSPPG